MFSRRVYIIVLSIHVLSGCQLFGSIAVHDTSLDSEFVSDRWIASFGARQNLFENLNVFIIHDSMPMINENRTDRPGSGVNQIGAEVFVDLFE